MAYCSCRQPMAAVIYMVLLYYPVSRAVETMITELLTSLDRRFQFVFSVKHLMVATLFMPTEVRQRVFEWLPDEVMRRDEDPQNEIYEACRS